MSECNHKGYASPGPGMPPGNCWPCILDKLREKEAEIERLNALKFREHMQCCSDQEEIISRLRSQIAEMNKCIHEIRARNGLEGNSQGIEAWCLRALSDDGSATLKLLGAGKKLYESSKKVEKALNIDPHECDPYENEECEKEECSYYKQWNEIEAWEKVINEYESAEEDAGK